MSSKLRLGDLPVDQDEMDNDYYSVESEQRNRKKSMKSKRKRSEAEDYMQQRSMKRSYSDQQGIMS